MSHATESPAAATVPHVSTPSRCWSSTKLRAHHFEGAALVYVRQSTQQQVLNHRESTARQYSLVDMAVQLGWPPDRVEVIDEDQGHSGSTAEGRHGFQRLLAEVGLDHVGIILGLELSRLARSNKDWHQLIELCAIFGTMLADQDGLYDPTDYNDRLLLGLRGIMNEAELHILQGRMHQAVTVHGDCPDFRGEGRENGTVPLGSEGDRHIFRPEMGRKMSQSPACERLRSVGLAKKATLSHHAALGDDRVSPPRLRRRRVQRAAFGRANAAARRRRREIELGF